MTKEISPGRLTSTVSGHVESGYSYRDAAIKETIEETGVKIDEDKLADLGVVFADNLMRAVFAYPYG